MFEELPQKGCEMFEELPQKGCEMFVQNSTDSHKPVEISYLRAPRSSGSGEA